MHDLQGRGQAFPLAADAVKAGLLTQDSLDRAARNVLTQKFATRLVDNPYTPATAASIAKVVNTHSALAKKVAVAGSVLLTNVDRTLPLTLGATSTIALVGPNAGCDNSSLTSCDAMRSLFGGYTGWPGDDKVFSFKKTAETEGVLPKGAKLLYAEGCKTSGNDTSGFAAAVEVAKKADVVIAVVGDSGDLGWNQNTCGEDDDRTVLDLPGVQPELLDAILQAVPNTPVVVVLVHGRPVTFVRHNLLPRLSAVLATWRPAEQAGPAVWDLLLGKENPSGRLAQAWIRSAGYV